MPEAEPIVDKVDVGNAHTDDVVYLWFSEEFVERNYENFADNFVVMSRAEASGLCGDVAAGLMRAQPARPDEED